MLYTDKNSTDELLSIINDLQHQQHQQHQQTDSGNSSECSSSSSCNNSKLESTSCQLASSSLNPDTGNCGEVDTGYQVKLNKAPVDYKILNDERLVKNLLQLEDYYRIQANYFQHVQTEIKPWMRKMLATWMLDVCKNQSREEDVFVLAMNLLDRFLSVQHIGKRHLQLLGTVCMFIAAKLRSAVQFNAETLVIYTANSISIEELLNWEQFVLHKLKWDTCAVTPNDFLPHLLNKFNLIDDQLVRQTVSNFIALTATDIRFSMIPSSMIASACFFAAIKSLDQLTKSKADEVLEQVNLMTGIDLECLKEVEQQVEELVSASLKVTFKFVGDENCPVVGQESDSSLTIDYGNMEIKSF